MSSATSTDPSTSLRAGRSTGVGPAASISPGAGAAAFRPWQFFLLAGMLAATAVVFAATGQSPASIVFLSLTVIAASLVGLAVYRSLAPLVSPETIEQPAMAGGRTRAALEREKALVLRSIKELEFDFAMKKIARSDYEEMSARLRGRAMGLMRQLEAGDGYRDRIERELQARTAGVVAGLQARPNSGAAASAEAAPVGKVPRRRTCSCGTLNDPDARFCKNCGQKLESPA